MVGITGIGVYVPAYRLSREEVAKLWGIKGLPGEKSVAGYDEDSITMAVAAALHCMDQEEEAVDGLFFATTTAPYTEKQAAAIIAGALDLSAQCHTIDFSNSLRAGTSAMKAAIDSVKCGSSENVIVGAADCRMGAAKSIYEQLLGDGAAVVMIGNKEVIATISGTYSTYNEFSDLWRAQSDPFLRSTDGRFIIAEGYIPTMKEAISGLMKKYKLTPEDFSKVVFYAPDPASHTNLAKSLGFKVKTQVQDPFFMSIGNTGTAAALIMLGAALEKAKPGDKILFASYGDGSDAFVLDVTEAIHRIRDKSKIEKALARKIPTSYGKYINWRNLIPIEASRRPERVVPSVPCLWRERKSILALRGVKCRKCGTPQYPPARVCAVCQSKDDFEDYKFSRRRGQIFTFTIDYLQTTRDPPGINGVIDFDGGGRILCEFTDCTPDMVQVGLSVEMTFRKLYEAEGISNYFWKAKPMGTL